MAYLKRALVAAAALISLAACSPAYSASVQPRGLPPQPQPSPATQQFGLIAQRFWSGIVVDEMTLTLRRRGSGKVSERDVYLVVGEQGMYVIANVVPDASCPSGIEEDALKSRAGRLEFTVEGFYVGRVGAADGIALVIVESTDCMSFDSPEEPPTPPAAPLPARLGDYA